jgi:hypothetical protein
LHPGGVAQWTSHPPQEKKTRVQIHPGHKVLGKNTAVLLCMIDLFYYALCEVGKERNKGIAQTCFFA